MTDSSQPVARPTSSRASAYREIRWERDMRKVPPLNQLVVAFMDGHKAHSDETWRRDGFALMVRHMEGWSEQHMQEACKRLDADELRVTAWLLLEDPDGDC